MLLDTGGPLRKFGNRHGRNVGDAQAADTELQGLLFQARAAADRAFAVDEELLAPLLAVFGVVVLGAADVFGDALPRNEVVAARRTELREVDRQRLGIAVENSVQTCFGQRADGVVEREVITAAQHFEDGEKHVVAELAQRFDGPFAQRQFHVGNDFPDVEHRLLAQTVAMGTGALRRVERKGMRRGVLESHARRGAHQMARIEALLLGAVIVNGHRALALPHRLPERSHHAVAGVLGHDEPVHDQIDRMDFIAVETHAGRNLADLAVDARIDISFLGQRLEQFAVVALAALHDGSHQGDFTPGKARHDQLGDLLVGVMHHLLARDGRIGARRARIEQTQEVVDLGNRADGRTGILVGRLLFDGHHGAETRDLVHVGTLHRPHELTRIGRERLHVATLPLGVDRVERERRFARTRKARYDNQFAARNLQIDILEVVDPCAQYFDRIFFHHRN